MPLMNMNLKEAFTTLPQYVLPHHALSHLMSLFTHCEHKAFKNLLIQQIINHYGVNMAEAANPNINAYASFNQFFTRALQPGLRPIASKASAVACPADGVVSQAGMIADGNIFQAKGKSFTATALLGGDAERAAAFNNGAYATIYLSPKDYHRLHMPLTGTLKEMVHIPGRLFSVNTATTNSVPGLFARNERVACLFETAVGPMALVLVGAIFVSSIETVWHGVVTPPTIASVQNWRYTENSTILQKGDEMGRFNMGSTIIVLFSKDAVRWQENFKAEQPVRMGEMIGELI